MYKRNDKLLLRIQWNAPPKEKELEIISYSSESKI